jgi:hypothetical protein
MLELRNSTTALQLTWRENKEGARNTTIALNTCFTAVFMQIFKRFSMSPSKTALLGLCLVLLTGTGYSSSSSSSSLHACKGSCHAALNSKQASPRHQCCL